MEQRYSSLPLIGMLQVQFPPCPAMCRSILGQDSEPHFAPGGFRLVFVSGAAIRERVYLWVNGTKALQAFYEGSKAIEEHAISHRLCCSWRTFVRLPSGCPCPQS